MKLQLKKFRSLVIEDAISAYKQKLCPPPAYFYCSRNTAEPGRSEAVNILASIARQLSSLGAGQSLLKPAIEAFETHQDDTFADGSLTLDQIRQLILDVLGLYPMATIIIDALDECNPAGRRHLLQTLQDLLVQSPCLVKIFISSRDDQDIVYRLQDYPNLLISSRKNQKDIVQFVRHETMALVQSGDLLRSSTNKDAMQAVIIESVTAKADGM